MTPELAAEAAARLTLASLTFADEPAQWWGPALADWVAAFEPLPDLAGVDVEADAGLGRLRWRLRGTADVVGPRASRWFDHLGLGRVATPGGADATVTCWLDVDADDLRSGWDVELGLGTSPADAWALLPATPALGRLAAWGDERGVAFVHRVGALAGGDGDVEVVLGLPGGTLDEQVAAAMSLFDHLAVEAIPDGVLSVLAAVARPRLLARVSLTGDGVASLGIGMVEPPTEAVLRLCDATGVGDDDSLAAFEGALGVTDRVLLEAVRHVGGVSPRIGYRLV